jgi:hypothetical protein
VFPLYSNDCRLFLFAESILVKNAFIFLLDFLLLLDFERLDLLELLRVNLPLRLELFLYDFLGLDEVGLELLRFKLFLCAFLFLFPVFV